MAKVEFGKTLITSTGSTIVSLDDYGLDIDDIILWVANSSAESSAGYSDGSGSFTGSARYGDENLNNTITHYRNISGVKTKVFEATVTLLDIGEFTLNTTTLTAQIELNFVAREK